MLANVLPSDKWYLSLLHGIAQHVPPLQDWLGRKADGFENEAIAAYEQGDLERAAAKYRRAIDWQPANIVYRNNLGQIYEEMGKLDQAELTFHLALLMDYQDRRSLKGLGVVLQQQGKFADAMYYYLRFIELEPKDGDVCYNLCVVFYELGQYDEAVTWSERAIEVTPSDLLVLRMRAQSLAAVGRLDETRAVLDRAAELWPDDPEIDNLLGLTLDLQGQPEASLKAFQEASRKDPGNAEIRLQIARLSALVGNHEAAEKEARHAVTLFSQAGDAQGSAAAYWELGWSHYNLGNMEASLQASSEALRFDPLLTPVYFNMGLALLRLGRVEEAREQYVKGLTKLSEVSELKTHAIDDLHKALERQPDLAGAGPILQMLEEVYDAASRDVADAVRPAVSAAADPALATATQGA